MMEPMVRWERAASTRHEVFLKLRRGLLDDVADEATRLFIRAATLSACGLGEARLMLRTPAELSDGQRDRFRIAYALSKCTEGSFVVLDEFTAALDRTLAKVVAFNVRKLVTRSGVGLLAATTHEDIVDDLQPDLLVRCGGDGAIEQSRWGVKKKG